MAKCDLNSTVADRRSSMLEEGHSEVIEALDSLDTRVSEDVDLPSLTGYSRSKRSFSLPQSVILAYLWCIETVVNLPSCRVGLLSWSMAELFEIRIRTFRPLALYPDTPVPPPSNVREVGSTCHTSRDMHCDPGIRNSGERLMISQSTSRHSSRFT